MSVLTPLVRKARTVANIVRFGIVHRRGKFDIPTAPHFDEDFKARFTPALKSSRFYVEYGGGGSTALAASLSKRTITIESDRSYAAFLARTLKTDNQRIVHVDIGHTHYWGQPIRTTPTTDRVGKWAKYPQTPFAMFDSAAEFPDLFLIDGRFRRACLLEIVFRAKGTTATSTVFFDDYYNEGRDHYHMVERFAGAPERVGRGAVFLVDGSTGANVTERDLSEAYSDFR